MIGLQSIFLRFLNELDKFNNTGTRMLDSICHMTFKLLTKLNFSRDKVKMLPFLRKGIMDVIKLNNLEKTDPSEIERTYNIRKQQTMF